MSSKPGFWRVCRITFRCARFAVWAVVLSLLLAFAWFNRIGLPGFVKTRLVSALHERGVQLEFTRMRLRFYYGLVCDNVRIGLAQGASGPVLRAREVQLRVNYPALLHLRAQVDGLVLRQGNFMLPLGANDALRLTNLQGELRILPDATWSLDDFRVDFAGATFTLAGAIAHAPECRNWKLFTATETADRGSVEASLRSFSDTLRQLHFEGKPLLNARLDGDARNVHSFAFTVSAWAPGAETPWFSAHNLEFTARVTAPTNAPVDHDPAWGFWTNLQPFRLDWRARGTDLKLAALAVDRVEGSGYWNAPEFVLTGLSARLGGGQLETGARLDIGSRTVTFTANSDFDWHAMAALLPDPARARLTKISWTHPPRAQADGTLVLPAWTNTAFWQVSGKPTVPDRIQGASGWEGAIAPGLRLRGYLAVTNVRVAGVTPLEHVQAHFAYTNRVWSVPDLEVTQGRTTLNVAGEENEASNGFNCVIGGKVDAESVRPFLTTSNAVRGFDYLRFRKPVTLALAVTGNLRDLSTLSATGHVLATDFTIRGQADPPPTNSGSGREAEPDPGVRPPGDLAVTNALVAGVTPLDSVQAHFSYTNGVWSLADLELTQGRTTLNVAGEENDANKSFNCVISGKLDVESLRPFLTTSNVADGFGLLRFGEPVTLALALAGNWRDFSTLSATGQVAAMDFAIRGQAVDSVTAVLAYTNLTAEFFHPQLARANGREQFAAEKLTLDLAGQRLFLHGGAGRVSPVAVGAAIGPMTAEAMAPYQFRELPKVMVEGCIPLKQRAGALVTDDADVRFDVIGTTPFRWRKFQTPSITGTIHWLAKDLILTNVVSECYGGTARGWGVFDTETPGEGTDFSFFIDGTNVDFNAMGRALWSPTNHLRGALSGRLMVTRANSSNWRTWNGYGQAQLRNGLLWDAPILGLMSPVLNTLTLGLDIGNSRATEGAGRFTLTNGVLHTDSLEIHSQTMRLNYVGTVDLEENVAARVRAQLLRNTPVVGGFVSLVLMPVSKAFECEVTGTLDQPKITPIYIPFSKVLTAPLHPLSTIEKIFTSPSTNSP